MKKILLTLAIITYCGFTFSQTATQTIKGKVVDQINQETLIGANIVLLNSDPLIGTITDINGVFILENIPVGRHSFEISMLGYQNYIAENILVSSGKQVILNIELKEDNIYLNEVVVVGNKDKSKPNNSMATLSSRQFSVEQTQRFAGGMDDPARLVSSFAGVANPSISSNGISVRGNSPSGLLWRIEGVEVPSPNHFADLNIAGAGLLSVLSSQVMDNSDFYTGAFPAEYGNATSGVFDINLRNGNYTNREYTFKAGLLGMEFATEGPLKKGNEASYLFNYRYSTLALIGNFLPNDAGILKYQDLSYKINLPTKKLGTFSIWGVGAYDGIDTEAKEIEEWESITDRDNSQTSQYMYATGLNHKLFLSERSILNTSLSTTGNGLDFSEQRLDNDLMEHPHSNANNDHYKITFQSALTNYIGDKYTMRTGCYYTHMGYKLDIRQSPSIGTLPTELSIGKGETDLFQVYSSSKINLNRKVEMKGGIQLMYFSLNEELSIEPRIALKYKITENQSFALAVGRHSKIESLPIYFVKNTESFDNKNLKLMNSNQIVLSYHTQLSKNLKLTVEPYYQYLTNVPVSPSTYISTLNIQNSLFFDEELVSEGKARNIGLDVTLERFLHNGMYYILSASIFDSKYTPIDGIERNTRFNKNYLVNALIGKEWQIGKNKNNLFSANLRMNYLGGNRKETIDQVGSAAAQDVVYGETAEQLSFTDQFPDLPIFSLTLSYRKNKRNYSSVWSLQLLNASQTADFETHIFNQNTLSVEEKFSNIMIPNLSYKIEF